MTLCNCGCGQPAPIAKVTRTARGEFRGQPLQYIRGHKPPLPRPVQPIEDRFWSRVNKGEPNECWEWTGPPNEDGYGIIFLSGARRRKVGAHRMSYQLHYGEVAPGLVVRHTCDNPPCVNPQHLLLGTDLDNRRDAVDRNRVCHGSIHPKAKLTEADVVEIRRLRAAGMTYVAIGERYGISNVAAGRAAKGITWRRLEATA